MSVQVKGSGTIGGLDEGLVVSGIVTSSTQINVGSNIKLGNAGVVTATSFVGSGANLTGLNSDLVNDTSPQLGGNLDNNGKNITFGDSAGSSDDRLTFGAGTDLSIYHDDSNSRSRIEHSTDNALEILQGGNAGMLIQNQNSYNIEIKTNAEDAIKCVANGAVELYHNNSKKLETASGGVTVTGTVAATSYTGDGSSLTGISVGIATTASQVSGITTVIDLNKDDIRLDCTGLVTIDTKGGTEGGNHVLRIVNSGISTVTFSSYFKFPSGGTPALPTASGAISLVSFTVHTQGRVGVASVFLAGASVNFS